jgi:NodT family efflux transporter outer membrane factor (OMF) lipoprotein
MRLRRSISLVLLAAVTLQSLGCTGPLQYVRNGFKVGPNYGRPPAPVADDWIEAGDQRVRRDGENDHLADWWKELNDPTLDRLIQQAYQDNLTLREAGFRILAARAQLTYAIGNFFPQLQTADGAYTRFGIGDTFFDQWNFGFNLAWELDFWGRFRRAIRSAEATLDASVEDYDAVLVTLLGDVASNYVRYRTTEERIRLLENVVAVQEDVLQFITRQLDAGAAGVTDLDRAQSTSDLAQSRAQLDDLQIQLQQSQNLLCILLGMPVVDLSSILDAGDKSKIPVTPDYVVVGIPADLLRRRPDVRQLERQAAAQAELIGIAEADLYPAFSIGGTLGWQAAKLSDLFKSQSLNSNVGGSFQWNILNYGRILSDIRFQEAQFQALVTAYQNQVLQAGLEVENGIVTFLKSQERARNLEESVDNAALALEVVIEQYEAGLDTSEFNRYAVIQQTLIQQQDLWAQARGQIVLGLIDVYRALGGGWQIRLEPTGPLPRLLPPVEDLPVGIVDPGSASTSGAAPGATLTNPAAASIPPQTPPQRFTPAPNGDPLPSPPLVPLPQVERH